MTYCRLIAPDWLKQANPTIKKVIEGFYSDSELTKLNQEGYNVYYFPNHPKEILQDVDNLDGSQIDCFEWVFVDFDLKSGTYPSKEAFIDTILQQNITPTKIVDSGNGIHIYWKVLDLDAKSYLRISRRLMRLFKIDEAVGKILQLMRLPGFLNTKVKDAPILCEVLAETDTSYTCEELDKLLPTITPEDEQYCVRHYNMSTNQTSGEITINDSLPAKFNSFILENQEAKDLFAGSTDDRSKSDYRLGHLMMANGFSKEEAISVLVNTAKALSRAPTHRLSYATNIVDKIWTFENNDTLGLSSSVADILKKSSSTLKGTRFKCHKRIDNTVHGFRLGQVIGLVGGSGIGKTSFALNMFMWFARENPDYHHFFVPLEQPANEIANRWQMMCGEDTSLHEKVHVLSNYDDNGGFRHLSFSEIREHIELWQKTTGKKIGCVVIDHIGALKKKGSNNENQDLISICHDMKAFAVQTNTLLVMQSQTSREKAGIGDLELNKDAAYGTSSFEWYCDYLVTLWQPLKRCHSDAACPTVTAFKFCKIRHKDARKDVIQEDVPYYLYYDTTRELMLDMTQDQEISFRYFLGKAISLRKLDRKTGIIEYKSVPYMEGIDGADFKDSGQHKRH